MTPQMDTSEQQELKNVVQGTIHLPGGAGYDERGRSGTE